MYFNLSDKIIKWLNKNIEVYNVPNYIVIEETFNELVNLLDMKKFNIININQFKEEYIKYLYKYSYVE